MTDLNAAGDGGSARILSMLADEMLRERRRRRRWGIFFKSLFGILLLILAGTALFDHLDARVGPHTAVVRVNGVIGADGDVNADDIISGLQAAFDGNGVQGVIVRINSPGGSAVQAGRVYAEIRRLRDSDPAIPVYAVIDDVGASGGYYIAAATDEIFADGGSLVGSIGVLMDGFGFVDAMHKLGVERRLITAGAHKGMLDPFSPLRDDERRQAESLVNNVYQQFVAAVKQSRGSRLVDDPSIFSGLVWTGQQAIKLGLVDGLGSTESIARNVVGAETMVDYTVHPDWLTQVAHVVGTTLARNWLHVSQSAAIQFR